MKLDRGKKCGVLVMHADDAKTKQSVAVLQKALEDEGIRVDLISPASAGSSPVSTAPYGLVCIVSGYKGWWKPQIPVEMDGLIKKPPD